MGGGVTSLGWPRSTIALVITSSGSERASHYQIRRYHLGEGATDDEDRAAVHRYHLLLRPRVVD